MAQWHKADLFERMYLPLEGGKKCSMPRYYKNKLYTEYERDLVAAAQGVRIRLADDEKNAALAAKYGEEMIPHMKLEADKASFQKMYINSLKNRDL